MADEHLTAHAAAHAHTNRWWDRLVISVLSSPLHPVASGSLAVLRLRGRRTARRITLPVQYARNESTIVIAPGRPETKRWWRNLRNEQPVDLLVRGTWLHGLGQVLTPVDHEYTSARSIYVRRWHSDVLGAGNPVVRIRIAEEN